METNNEKTRQTRPASYTGIGIALGVGIGATLGVLPLPGNMGLIMGASIGVALGIVTGAIGDNLKRPPVFTLVGMAVCAVLGGLLGLAIDLLFSLNDCTGPGMWFGIAIGLVIGTVIETRRKRQVEGGK